MTKGRKNFFTVNARSSRRPDAKTKSNAKRAKLEPPRKEKTETKCVDQNKAEQIEAPSGDFPQFKDRPLQKRMNKKAVKHLGKNHGSKHGGFLHFDEIYFTDLSDEMKLQCRWIRSK